MKIQMIDNLSPLKAIFFTLVVFLLPLVSEPVQAVDLVAETVTENELRLLPSYCKDTDWFPARHAQRKSYWIAQMGDTFQHLHHYCWAMFKENRSLRPGIRKGERISLRTWALRDYFYVIRKAPDDFILLPEIYTRVGGLELLRKNPEKAKEAFNKSWELKPDYWPAYSQWAGYLMQTGRRAEALDVVKTGLRNAPSAKVLLEQYRVLGGKPADIPSPTSEPKVEDGPASKATRSEETINPLTDTIRINKAD